MITMSKPGGTGDVIWGTPRSKEYQCLFLQLAGIKEREGRERRKGGTEIGEKREPRKEGHW